MITLLICIASALLLVAIFLTRFVFVLLFEDRRHRRTMRKVRAIITADRVGVDDLHKAAELIDNTLS